MITPFSLKGFAYNAGSSRQLDVRLDGSYHQGETCIRIIGLKGDEVVRCVLHELKIDVALGSTVRKLTFPDGTVFETSDHSGFKKIEVVIGDKFLHRLEQFGPHLFGICLACLGVGYLLWRYGLDLLAGLVIIIVPNIVVEQIDRGVLQTIDYVLAEPSNLDEGKKDDVRLIYKRLIAALPDKERKAHKFTLLFRDIPSIGPNAFALPGGTMVITDELVSEYLDKDILAGILGHEIGHVVDEHGLRRLYRSFGAYVLVAVLMGETGPLMEDFLLEGNALLALSYSRMQETQADKFGLSLSYRAGFNPTGLKKFFQLMLLKKKEKNHWMSSHPNHKTRINDIDIFLDSLLAP